MRRTQPQRLLLPIFLFVATVLASCTPPAATSQQPSGGTQPSPSTVASPRGAPSGAAGRATGQITVFAASSLTDAFTALGTQFQTTNPGTQVTFNFGSSTQLFTQIDQGASADVFASADQIQMDRARTARRIDGQDTTFATNRLVVITPADNPAHIAGPADLAQPGVKLVTSQEDVPIGVYTQTVFDKMSQEPQIGAGFKDRVSANIVSREANVRQIVSKVLLGEADAGVVYKTDVTPRVASQLKIFEIPDAYNTLATYPIARVKDGPNPQGAEAFVTFVESTEGQATLASWNFGPAGPAAQ